MAERPAGRRPRTPYDSLVDKTGRNVYHRAGRRKVEVEETTMLSLPHFEGCPECFARLHNGTLVDSCDCIAYLVKELDGTP